MGLDFVVGRAEAIRFRYVRIDLSAVRRPDHAQPARNLGTLQSGAIVSDSGRMTAIEALRSASANDVGIFDFDLLAS